jgi:hypothetical protein
MNNTTLLIILVVVVAVVLIVCWNQKREGYDAEEVMRNILSPRRYDVPWSPMNRHRGIMPYEYGSPQPYSSYEGYIAPRWGISNNPYSGIEMEHSLAQ